MLAAARARRPGRDVVIGVVETHGRSETAALLAGLDRCRCATCAYRGRTLAEFDLDAALARKPAVLLVDELAHTNAPGSRHAKRWQDVQELLAAGIEVWSALNVQHLESLNGVVGAITGVRVHETVPDTVLDEADEVVLVDLPPDELLRGWRPARSTCRSRPSARRANFFRKGNLIALREIALRRTAEHVEDDVAAGASSSRPRRSAAGLEHLGRAPACVGPRRGRRASRCAPRRGWRAAQRALACGLCRDAAPAAPARCARATASSRAQAGRGTGCRDGGAAGVDVGRGTGRARARLNCATLVVGRTAGAGLARWWPRHAGRARWRAMRRRRHRGGRAGRARAGSRARPARGAATPSEDARAPAARWPGYAWAAASSVAITLLATPLRGVLELANIVMLFLLGGGRRGDALRPRAGGAGGGAQRGGLRFLLRAAAPLVRGRRRAVPA